MRALRRTLLLALALGLGCWLARFAFSSSPRAPVRAVVSVPSAALAPASAAPSPPAAAEPSPAAPAPETGDERLLREVATLSAEFDRLRAQYAEVLKRYR